MEAKTTKYVQNGEKEGQIIKDFVSLTIQMVKDQYGSNYQIPVY
jgi:hypothetical protein